MRWSILPNSRGAEMARLSMPSPFANGQPKSKIAPFPAIGRAICCAGPATVTWSRWWIVIRVSACWRSVPGKDTDTVVAQHKTFTMATDMQVYFCDPQSSWQRGSGENTNGLLRQYLPKNADLSRFSQSELDEIALRLNTRPRQTLGFRTPADKLQASVASPP